MNRKIVFVLFCTIVSNCIAAQKQLKEQLDELLKVYDNSNAPGLSVKVIKAQDELYSNSFGLANLDYSIKNSDSTIFSLASIGKQFTASAIWALINESKIALEDDIRTYLPEFPKYKKPIKIKHLLNHTSGIRNYHTLMQLSGFDYHITYYDNLTVLELACKQKGLNNVPGDKVTYSNTNYNLLALIVERVSGHNLNDYIYNNILKPLKMNYTFVRVSHGKTIKNKAIGYQKRNGEFVYNVTNQLSYGAGNMGSSIKDMGIWMQMLNGQISEFIGLAKFLKTTEVFNNGTKANYARGIMVDTYKGYNTASHGGFGFGGRSKLIALPELKLGIIVLSNLQSINASSIAYQILDKVLESYPKKLKIEAVTESFKPQDLNMFIGEY